MATTRFSVSLDKTLLDKFDRQIKSDGCPTRSKAVADLIRAALVRSEWQSAHEVAGAIILVYDHHKRDIARTLTAVQHDFHQVIISTQHVHLDHDNCLEIIALRGPPDRIRAAAMRLKSVKGLKHFSLAAATTGASLR